MPKKYIPAILSIVAIIVLASLTFISTKPAKASLTSCTINSTTPQSITSGQSGSVVFNITNSDDGGNLVHWVKVTRPTGDYTITSGDGPSLGGTTIGDGGSSVAIMTTLSSGETGDFTVGFSTTGGVTSSGSFVVEASDSSEGVSPVTCSGDTSFSLTSGGASSISITNVSASVSASSAALTWNTSIPTTGAVYYGTTSGYGASGTDTTLGTSHSVNISGLSSSTLYHFKVTSTDQSNNTAELADNTFTTGAAGATTTVTTTVTNTVSTTVTKTYTDTTPPTVRFKTEFKKIYTESPLVEIVSSDGTGIAKIEYSTDDGTNWTQIDLGDNFGDKQITSMFTPNASEDGDYSLRIKVIDTMGNKGLSKEAKFTIDRLPPRVGPIVVMAGPLIINSNNAKNMDLLAGVEYKFIVSSAGGPNKINMSCGDSVYDFYKNNDIGVWTAKVKFDKDIDCVPKITAVDGANNIQEVEREKIIINKLGTLKNGTITVYWYDEFEKKFVRWDGEPYGQVNPINTNDLGGYSFLLPAGKYYLEAKALGKRTTVSNIIETKDTIYINDDWQLSPVWRFWQLREEKIITPKMLASNTWNNTNFSLPKVKLNNLSTLDVRGKTSIVSLLSSWHPSTNDYLKMLDNLSKDKINVYPILIQEKDSASNFLKRRGGYNTIIYADPDGEILNNETSAVLGLPTTWIVNRFGQVVKTKVGVINYQEAIDVISKID